MQSTPKSLATDLLLDERYHLLRYVVLCVALLIFSISEITFNYVQLIGDAAGQLSLILLIANCFLWKVAYLVVLVKLLVPRFFNRGRYGFFFVSLLVVTVALVGLQYLVEGGICSRYGIATRYTAPLHYIALDAMVLNIQWLIVIIGVILGLCVKRMAQERQLNQQQQAERAQMETALMKQQISPAMLCTTLHTCGQRALTDAEATSGALLRFSRVLRYQLYDSRRELSLLKGELDFVHEYLNVLQFDGVCKSFTINTDGSIMGIMVPPLVFTSLMQYSEPVGNIDCHFTVGADNLQFTIIDGRTNADFSAARKRLSLLYADRYSLIVNNNGICLTIPIS